MDVGEAREHDCMDAGGRQKTAPAFSAFATSLWFSNAGAVAEERKLRLLCKQSLHSKYQRTFARLLKRIT
jgi:hypothetical protein